METKKLSDFRIEVKKEDIKSSTQIYDYHFLVEQRARILLDMSNYAAARQKDLDEVDGLLAECKKLGIEPLI
jgi:hypothetical protein